MSNVQIEDSVQASGYKTHLLNVFIYFKKIEWLLNSVKASGYLQSIHTKFAKMQFNGILIRDDYN